MLFQDLYWKTILDSKRQILTSTGIRATEEISTLALYPLSYPVSAASKGQQGYTKINNQ